MKTIRQLFNEKMIKEAKEQPASQKPGKEDIAQKKLEQQLENLLEIFPLKQEKAIVSLMIALGAPLKSLMLYKSDLKKNVQGPADMYIKNNSLRIWIRKLMTALEAEKMVEEDVEFDRKLSNKYQQAVYHILKALGMPEQVETNAQRALIAGIRKVAMLAVENRQIAVFLMGVADQLGVSGKIKAMPDVAKKEVKEEVITENAEELTATVTNLLELLGFDLSKQASLSKQMNMPFVKQRLNRLSSSTTIVTKMNLLNQAMQKIAMRGEPVGEAVDNEQNKWSFAVMGDHIMLTCAGMKIKMTSEEASKLQAALDDKDEVSIRSGSKRFKFSPMKDGSCMIEDLTGNAGECKMNKNEVKDVLDLISKM